MNEYVRVSSFNAIIDRFRQIKIKMKVSAVIFLCVVAVTVAVAIPVQPDINTNSQLTLADIENEQNAQNYVEGDDNSPAAREKRFILKKIALYKLGKLTHFGLG